LRTEREVEVFLKVPALATLPVFSTDWTKARLAVGRISSTPKVAKG